LGAADYRNGRNRHKHCPRTAIHFKEVTCALWKKRSGVRGIKLKKEDRVIGMDIVLKGQKGNQVLIISENGYGKRTALESYKIQTVRKRY